MEIDVHDEQKLVCIWLKRSEAEDAALKRGLAPLYAEYKAKNYFVAVFESGNGDLISNTIYLLQTNLRAKVQS